MNPCAAWQKSSRAGQGPTYLLEETRSTVMLRVATAYLELVRCIMRWTCFEKRRKARENRRGHPAAPGEGFELPGSDESAVDARAGGAAHLQLEGRPG